jgi:hypothetical protein
MKRKTAMAASLLLLFGAVGCADLQVTNLNAPDRDRALADAQDLEALIGGGYRSYWLGQASQNGPMAFMSVAAHQHSAFPANFAMVDYSQYPRIPINNSTAAGERYSNFAYAWTQNYKAISAVAAGFQAMDAGIELGRDEDGQDLELRARAYGRFVQGVAHGSIAILYDQGYIFDETMDPEDTQDLKPYTEVMTAAYRYLDEAYALTQSGTFELPESWMTVKVNNEQLGRLIRSVKARLRASVARTPAERKAVAWTEVIADVDAGITADWEMIIGNTNDWTFTAMSGNIARVQWGQLSYFVLGMADQSGNYQKWMSLPVMSRAPTLDDGTPFLIVTPDLRFAQGATVEDQRDNPGTIYQLPSSSVLSSQWLSEARGKWRWAYYRDYTWDDWRGNLGKATILTRAELDLLKAEALYHETDYNGAAALINPYRLAAGLSATDGAGTNTSCVPKLADESCGDLWEMLKWEKRLETMFRGAYGVSWFFDGRGWGDLPEGTPLQFPVPDRDLQLLHLPTYTFGGVGEPGGAPVGSYGY